MPSMNFYSDDPAGQAALLAIAQSTSGTTALVHREVSDQLVCQLTGHDVAYFRATGNLADAVTARERAQRMWDALVNIANATGSAT